MSLEIREIDYTGKPSIKYTQRWSSRNKGHHRKETIFFQAYKLNFNQTEVMGR